MNAAVLGRGAMGMVVKNVLEAMEDVSCVAVVEPQAGESLMDIDQSVDVVIDFSHPDNLRMLELFVEERPCPLVIATTGHSGEEKKRIAELAEKVPVVFSANYSLGVAVLKKMVSDITPILEDSFDIELIEKHHNRKLDAPSGTAKALLSAIDPWERYERVYGRAGNGRRSGEIGVHAVRGGSIVGDHTVIFAGADEVLELTHRAGSRKIFAIGAFRAALFAIGQSPGLYSMEDVLWKPSI